MNLLSVIGLVCSILDDRDCLLREANAAKTANPSTANIDVTDHLHADSTTEMAAGHVDSITQELNSTSAFPSSTACTDDHDDNVPSETSTVNDPDVNVVTDKILGLPNK